MYTDNRGQNKGGSSQSAMDYVSRSDQQNADQSFQRYGANDAKQVGSVAFDQMEYGPSNAHNVPAGFQQQGLGANAQGRSCVTQCCCTL